MNLMAIATSLCVHPLNNKYPVAALMFKQTAGKMRTNRFPEFYSNCIHGNNQ